MRSVLLHWILNAAALWVAAALIPGLDFNGGVGRLLLVAAVFGVVNSTLRPLLTILTCPLIVLTLGLFTLVINAVMLLVTGWLSVCLVSMVLSLVLMPKESGVRSRESGVGSHKL